MPLPELDVARVQRWCAARVPEHARHQVRVECELAPRHLTIIERRAPWREDFGPEWTMARLPLSGLRILQDPQLERTRRRGPHTSVTVGPDETVLTNARRNALDEAIAPLLELAAPLRTGAQRDALAAYVIRKLHSAWNTRKPPGSRE